MTVWAIVIGIVAAAGMVVVRGQSNKRHRVIQCGTCRKSAPEGFWKKFTDDKGGKWIVCIHCDTRRYDSEWV